MQVKSLISGEMFKRARGDRDHPWCLVVHRTLRDLPTMAFWYRTEREARDCALGEHARGNATEILLGHTKNGHPAKLAARRRQ